MQKKYSLQSPYLSGEENDSKKNKWKLYKWYRGSLSACQTVINLTSCHSCVVACLQTGQYSVLHFSQRSEFLQNWLIFHAVWDESSTEIFWCLLFPTKVKFLFRSPCAGGIWLQTRSRDHGKPRASIVEMRWLLSTLLEIFKESQHGSTIRIHTCWKCNAFFSAARRQTFYVYSLMHIIKLFCWFWLMQQSHDGFSNLLEAIQRKYWLLKSYLYLELLFWHHTLSICILLQLHFVSICVVANRCIPCVFIHSNFIFILMKNE